MTFRGRSTALGMAGLAMLAAAIYLLRIDSVAGLILDDAWYMVLGKSLAVEQRPGIEATTIEERLGEVDVVAHG